MRRNPGRPPGNRPGERRRGRRIDGWQDTAGWLYSGREVPLLVKVPYALFVAVLVPVYWRRYGPANFLWFSDLALLVGLAAAWLESRLLAGMQAVRSPSQ